MPIDFPIPTSIGEIFTSGAKSWVWNGEAWDSVTPTAIGATGATGIGATGATGLTGATGVIPSSLPTLTVTGQAEFGIPVETKATPTISGGTLTLDLTAATFFYVALNAATSVVFSNPPASPKVFSFTLQFLANGTSYAVTWPTSVRWGNSGAPIITTANGRIDTFTFVTHDGGTRWFGFVSGQNF